MIIGLVWLSISQRPVPDQLVEIHTAPEIQTSQSGAATDAPAPIAQALPAPSPSPLITSSFVGQLDLIIPVEGVRPEQLVDTFDEARSEGRLHYAIDIMAPAGTPVLAATDGKILKLFQSDLGGTTIYQLSHDEKIVYYYAHLERYADKLTEGSFVRRGDTLAYVGDTGNAGAGNYHLHFSISAVSDPKRYWEGTNINPYPLLRR